MNGTNATGGPPMRSATPARSARSPRRERGEIGQGVATVGEAARRGTGIRAGLGRVAQRDGPRSQPRHLVGLGELRQHPVRDRAR